MSAKFIAQIETSATCAARKSEPAAATSPRIVSISGSPAATSDPNASTRIASVTGHEISSDFIIASRLAVLKSDQRPEAPVSATSTSAPPASASSPFSSSAARTMSVGLPAAPAWTIAVWPSREIETPARGGTTDGDVRRSPRSTASTRDERLRERGVAGPVLV